MPSVPVGKNQEQSKQNGQRKSVKAKQRHMTRYGVSFKDKRSLPTGVNGSRQEGASAARASRREKMEENPSFQSAMPFRSTYLLSREVVGGQQSSYKTDVDLKHGYLCVLEKTDNSSIVTGCHGDPRPY